MLGLVLQAPLPQQQCRVSAWVALDANLASQCSVWPSHTGNLIVTSRATPAEHVLLPSSATAAARIQPLQRAPLLNTLLNICPLQREDNTQVLHRCRARRLPLP